MQPNPGERRLRSAVKTGWTRFVGATRQNGKFALPRRRGRNGKNKLPAALFKFKHGIDPVELTVLALNLLGPAIRRANTIGKPLSVAVPNARVAEIFRDALARSAEERGTDRLIKIVIEEPPAPAPALTGAKRPH